MVRVLTQQTKAVAILPSGYTSPVLAVAVTGATNLGSTGQGIYSSILGRNLQFKKIGAGSGVSLSANTDTILVSTSGLVSTTGNTFLIDDQAATNVFPYKSNIDIKGTGQVTVTNGSASVVGIGTNFLNATTGLGLSYWFQMWVKDSSNNWYLIFLGTIPTNTSATISNNYSRSQIRAGFNSATNTLFQGVTGTYDYWIVRNWSDGLYTTAFGSNSYADNFSTVFGGSAVATGQTSFSVGFSTFAGGTNSTAIGRITRAVGAQSFAGGKGSGHNTGKTPLANGQTSFAFYEANSSQTLGHGALGANTAILGGINHNIPSDAPRSAIIGGNLIKAVAAVTDTVYMPKVRIGQGTGGGLTSGSTSNDILVRNIGGEIRVRSLTSVFTGLTANNGLTKSTNTIGLGGTLTGATVIVASTANTLTVRSNNLLTTTNSTFILTNDTDATVGVQQNSPTILLRGRGWKTNSTAASQTADYKIYALPVQGASNPTLNLVFAESISGGANSNVAVFSNSGGVSTLTLGVNGGVFASPGATVVSLVAGGASGTLKVNGTTTALTFGATSSSFADTVNATTFNAARFVATLANNNAGVNVGTGVGTPSNAINGDLWYTTTNTTYNGRLGANVHFIVNPQSTPIISGSIPVGTATGQVAPISSFTYASSTLSVPGKVAATATSTLAGVNVGSVNGNPSSLSNGDIWYDTGSNSLKARVNGATVTITVS